MRAVKALPRTRRLAATRRTSRCTIRRDDGSKTWDEATGTQVPAWPTVHIDLPLRYKGGGSQGSSGSKNVTIGGVEFSQATGEAHMPFDTYDLRDNDLIDITTGEWAGTVLRVVEAVKGDQRTARRVPVVEVDRPAEWG